jgi:hypothetical protein
MFTKTKKKVVFNGLLFESAIDVIKNASGQICAQYEIPIKYTYMGIQYSKLKYKYKCDSNGNVTCVLFSLPKLPQNAHMSCLVISGANTAEEAICNLKNIASNKYA